MHALTRYQNGKKEEHKHGNKFMTDQKRIYNEDKQSAMEKEVREHAKYDK